MKTEEVRIKEENGIKQEINNLLNKAESLKDSNLLEAINILNDVKNILPQLKREDDSKMSNKNVSHDKGTQEMLYLSKYGNILYEIGEYEKALSYYDDLAKKLPSNNEIYKAQGDCYRKLGQYEESLTKYGKGLEIWGKDKSAGNEDKAALLNSQGLSYMETGKSKEALDNFNEAIKLTNKIPNALYYCNQGAALYAQGNHAGSLEVFKKAHELVKLGKIAKGLNSENIHYINKTLEPFINQLQSMDGIALKKTDDIMIARQNKYVSHFINKLSESGSKEQELAKGENLIDSKSKLFKVQNNDKLYEYYDGCIFRLTQSYYTAFLVNTNAFKIDTSDNKVDIVSTLISFIPLIGAQISQGVSSIGSFVKKAGIKKAASNVCKFASTPVEFEKIAQDALLDAILQRENAIQVIKAKEYVLPKWASQFTAVLKKTIKTKEEIEEALYGDRNETELQKLGCKLANDIVEQEISSGKIYEGETAISIKPDEKKAKLTKVLLNALDQDIKDSNEQTEFKEGQVAEEGSTCCNIFAAYDIKYDNPLLNSPDLLKLLASHLGGVSNALALGSESDLISANLDLVGSTENDFSDCNIG
jgi:tetratricopeptide (TPR) repeat protein